jgi:hypothetical protein
VPCRIEGSRIRHPVVYRNTGRACHRRTGGTVPAPEDSHASFRCPMLKWHVHILLMCPT